MMDWFKVWQWPQKIAGFLIGLLFFALLLYVADWALSRHYTAEKELAHKTQADKAATALAARKAKNDKIAKDAQNAKIKSLEGLVADTQRVAAAAERLQNDLRASATDKTDLAACLQRADTLDTVQRRISEFTQRVVKAADGHVIDLKACTASWPQ